MDRHVEVKDPSAVVRKYDKYKQSLEPDGVYGEEVDRNHWRHVIGQKRPPHLRRRFGMSHHVFGHRCLRDWYPELEKFAVDSRRSPQHVISTHGSDQFAWPLEPSVVRPFRGVPSRSNTNGIRDDAIRQPLPASRSRVRIATETKSGTAKPINIGQLVSVSVWDSFAEGRRFSVEGRELRTEYRHEFESTLAATIKTKIGF